MRNQLKETKIVKRIEERKGSKEKEEKRACVGALTMGERERERARLDNERRRRRGKQMKKHEPARNPNGEETKKDHLGTLLHPLPPSLLILSRINLSSKNELRSLGLDSALPSRGDFLLVLFDLRSIGVEDALGSSWEGRDRGGRSNGDVLGVGGVVVNLEVGGMIVVVEGVGGVRSSHGGFESWFGGRKCYSEHGGVGESTDLLERKNDRRRR